MLVARESPKNPDALPRIAGMLFRFEVSESQFARKAVNLVRNPTNFFKWCKTIDGRIQYVYQASVAWFLTLHKRVCPPVGALPPLFLSLSSCDV